MKIKEGDSIFLFSDGFQDQFGGPKGKKFKKSKIRNIVIDNADQNLDKIEETLKSGFKNWKGKLENVDDVCVIGVKL